MSKPWSERINMLAINPDAATRDDIARMATDLMELYVLVEEAASWLPWHESDHPNCEGEKSAIGRKLREKIESKLLTIWR